MKSEEYTKSEKYLLIIIILILAIIVAFVIVSLAFSKYQYEQKEIVAQNIVFRVKKLSAYKVGNNYHINILVENIGNEATNVVVNVYLYPADRPTNKKLLGSYNLGTLTVNDQREITLETISDKYLYAEISCSEKESVDIFEL